MKKILYAVGVLLLVNTSHGAYGPLFNPLKSALNINMNYFSILNIGSMTVVGKITFGDGTVITSTSTLGGGGGGSGDVTTTTNQTISGQKTFTAPQTFTSSVTVSNKVSITSVTAETAYFNNSTLSILHDANFNYIKDNLNGLNIWNTGDKYIYFGVNAGNRWYIGDSALRYCLYSDDSFDLGKSDKPCGTIYTRNIDNNVTIQSSVTFKAVNSSYTTNGDVSALNGRWSNSYSSNSYICTINKCPLSPYDHIKYSTGIDMQNNDIRNVGNMDIGGKFILNSASASINTALYFPREARQTITMGNSNGRVIDMKDLSLSSTHYYLYIDAVNYINGAPQWSINFINDTNRINFASNAIGLQGTGTTTEFSIKMRKSILLETVGTQNLQIKVDSMTYVHGIGLLNAGQAGISSIWITSSVYFYDPITVASSATFRSNLEIGQDVIISSRPQAYLAWELNGSSITEITAGAYTVFGGTSALVPEETIGFKVVADAKGNNNRLTYIGAIPHRFTGTLGGCVNSATATNPSIQVRLNGNKVKYAEVSPTITVTTSDAPIPIAFKCSMSNGDYLEVYATTDDGDDISIDHMQLVVNASD